MKKQPVRLCSPNIRLTGRLIRGGSAIAMIVGAFLIRDDHRDLAALLALIAALAMAQAIRGWCVFRAARLPMPF